MSIMGALKGAAKGAIGGLTGGGGGIVGGALKGAMGGGGNTTTSPSAPGNLGNRNGLPSVAMNASPSTDMGGMASNVGAVGNKFASGKKTTAARKFSSRR
jgi:hypothetical protein